jgi:hypothetical protein
MFVSAKVALAAGKRRKILGRAVFATAKRRRYRTNCALLVFVDQFDASHIGLLICF